MKFIVALLVVLLCTGCASYFTGMGQNAATGAVNGITSDDSKKKLDGLASAATKAARDEALGPTTDADGQKLITDWGAALRGQLNTLITKELQDKLRETIRQAIDEALGKRTLKDVDALREELVGPPFQKDLDDAIDSAKPHLSSAVQDALQTSLGTIKVDLSNVQTQADQEAAKWKPIAIGFAIGTGFLLLCLIFAVILIRGHRKMIDKHQEIIASLVRERAKA
jgi:F0F1-type ATP synthase membrane subunit c/vacuolar-type H+-ATPase subunit K